MSASQTTPAVLTQRLNVGTASAGPGERSFGVIEVALPDKQTLPVPCWVIRGRRAGESDPVLYVHSTQHGNEISGIEVVRRVAQALDPRRLRGTVIAVPVANPLALQWRRHHYLQGPEEAYQGRPALDIDHFWPGDAGGTHVQRLAHALWQQGVRQATHVLDLHTWNRWQAAATTVRPWHAPSLELAKAFGLWVQAKPRVELDEQEPGSVTAVSIQHGKAACSPNFTGQWDIYEPEVRRGVAGLRRVLRTLGMLPGRPDSQAAPPVFSPDDLLDVRVDAPGYFLPRARPEQRVRRGDVLGVHIPLDTFQEQPVIAPIDGLVYLVGAITPGADVALPSMMPLAPAGGRVARLLPLDAVS